MSYILSIFVWWPIGFIPLAINFYCEFKFNEYETTFTVGNLMQLILAGFMGPLGAVMALIFLIGEIWDILERKKVFEIVLFEKKK